jgi:hypothetical protein
MVRGEDRMEASGIGVAPGAPGAIERRGLRLRPGSHGSPREGVCVVELASLLASERFSDRPRCVCRVIAAFLRSWNDRVSYADRQRLLPYAERIVGTNAGRATTHLRRDFCLIWAGADLSRGPVRGFLTRLRMRWRIAVLIGLRPALRLNEGAAELAARTVFAELGPGAVFRLLEGLLRAGEAQADAEAREPGDDRRLEPAPLADPVAATPQPRIAAAAGELAGDAQVANRKQGRQRQYDRRHDSDFARRHPRNRDKEDVEDDRSGSQQPERELDSAEYLHALEASGPKRTAGSRTPAGI